MGSEHPEQTKAKETVKPGEDDLLGVIADVERQLESLKANRVERDAFKQRLEVREQELEQRERDLSRAEAAFKERFAALSVESERHVHRLREVEAGEAELTKRREELEGEFAALADEQRRASEGVARESAELKAMSIALEQREKRLAEHTANISRQRESFEALGAELARRQESAEAEAAELERVRLDAEDLKSRLAESERLVTARGAELDQAHRRIADLVRRVSELTRAVEEAGRQRDEQNADLSEQLRLAKDEVKRAGEAQSALIAEVTQRDKAIEDARRESELLRAEVTRRQAGLNEVETRLADFKRQVIDRDTRIQELSAKLSAATTKFRELGQELQEQASLADQAHALQEELKAKDRTIAELKAGASSAGDTVANKADIEALEGQLQQMRTQLQESRADNRDLKTRLAQGSGAGGQAAGVPADVGEAIVTRWRRLRLMRSLLQEQGEKLREAGEAVRARYAQAEQILAQRDQLSQARAAISTGQERLQKLQARAALGKAGASMFYLVGALAGLVGLSWVVSGQVAPARYAARAVINADTRGRQTSEDQLSEWQKYLEQEIKDPRMHEAAAERMVRAGIASLSTPGQLAERMEKDLTAESGINGSLKIELRGTGKAKTIRELDTFVTSLVSEANATKERRPDGLGVLIAEKPNADAGPLESGRILYAALTFVLGLACCLGLGGLTYTKMSRAKVRIEQEQNIDEILDNSNWKQAEAQMRQARG